MAAAAALLELGSTLVRLALPPRCPGCGTVTPADHLFCADCWRRLDFLGPPECARCGAPFAHDLGPDALCGGCLAEPRPLDGVAAAVGYGEIARSLALKLKHGGRPGVARTLAAAMARRLPEGAWLVAPVPLHRWRIWRRGYNQSALVARELVRRSPALAYASGLVIRRKATPMLRGLNPAERRRTLAGAFGVPASEREKLRGGRVLLVDDVYTTGATADACARALKRAGAAEVRLICWARVVREDGVER